MPSSFQWFVSILKRRAALALTLALLVGAGGAGVYFVMPRKYHATFDLEVLQEPSGQSEVDRLKNLLSNSQGRETAEYAVLVKSQGVLEKTLERTGIRNPSSQEVDKLRAGVTYHGEMHLLAVKVQANEAEMAETLAKNLLRSLEEVEKQSRVFRLQESISNLENLAKTLEGRVTRVRLSRDTFVKVSDVEQKLAAVQPKIVAVRQDNEREVLLLHRQRAELLKSYTEDWHEIREIDDKIVFLKSFDALAGEPPSPAAPARERREGYRALLDEESRLLDEFDGSVLHAWRQHPDFNSLAAVDDEIRRVQENIDQVRRDVTKYRTVMETSAARHRVAKAPSRPSRPSSPDPWTVGVWTALLALAAGIGVVYVLAMMDVALHTVEDVQFQAQTEALPLIPHMDGNASWAADHPLAYGARGDGTQASEPFRMLKSSIVFSVPRVTSPVVLVTSSEAQEGKSTIVVNLAMAFAEDRRVLLVSSNMRRPTIHKILSLEAEGGLSDVLDGTLPWMQAVKPTSNPNLFVMTHGRIAENSSVLLSRPAFAQMLTEARQAYDAILIDSPPALLVIDAAVIAPSADAVVLVYSLGETQKQSLMRSLRLMKKVNGNLIGVVPNSKRAYSAAPGHYYYQYKEDAK